MLTLATKEHFAVGPDAESAFQPLASLPLGLGAQTIRVALSGEVNSKRGQLTLQLAGKAGLVVSGVQVRGFRATPNFHGQLGGTGLPFDFDVATNGSSPSEQMVAYLDVTLTVETAGEIELSVAAGNPMSEALPSDVALIRLAAMQVD